MINFIYEGEEFKVKQYSKEERELYLDILSTREYNEKFKTYPLSLLRKEIATFVDIKYIHRFITFEEKHGNRYFDIDTDDKLYDVALYQLKQGSYWWDSEPLLIVDD